MVSAKGHQRGLVEPRHHRAPLPQERAAAKVNMPKFRTVAVMLFLASGAAPAQDWPQWRGPNRDGVVLGVTPPAKWPKTLREEWKAPVGEGLASPVVVGAKAYVFTRQDENERVLCLDVSSGKELWRSEPYPAPYKRGLGEGNLSIGPRSTPVIADGKIYAFGMTGILSCLNAETGSPCWRQECTPYLPYSGNSPLVADGLCIIHYGNAERGKLLGGLTAFDAATGQVKWRYVDGSSASSSSPLLVTLAGERQVVLFTSWELLGVSAERGTKLWSLRTFDTNESLIVTPVLYKDMLIVAGHKESPRALRLEKGDKGIVAREVWKARGVPLHMSSPVVVGDRLFGMSSRKRGCFFCLDANSGKTHWESDGDDEVFGHASVVSAGDVVLFLTDRGRLIVAKTDSPAFEPIAEYKVSDGRTSAHPVFLGTRILIRDDASLRSFRIEAASAGE
jgi:outer membrane protein assembly factor BamB